MENEELLKKRFLELAQKSYRQNIYMYTGFLNPAELDVLCRMERELSFAGVRTWGGDEGCERQMTAFGSEQDMGYAPVFPICIMSVEPNAEKFAEELSHRDYLGAILNLGIDRGLIGDIRIRGKRAWFYCADTIADYLAGNLQKVRHTYVCCKRAEGQVPEMELRLQPVTLNVASERLDVVAAALTGQSRSKVMDLFREKKIFVNGRCMEKTDYNLKEGDVLSVRGFGKAVYDGVQGQSRKGRSYVELRLQR